MSDPAILVDMRERANEVELMFPRTALPQRLERRLDTTDFATPVNTIDTRREADRVRMTIALTGAYDLLSWQADGRYTLEARPLSDQERADIERERFAYTGERLSLNFQDIEVRSVLQLLADFTDLNIVVSDTVSGNITLRLRNVPWDQALELILVTKGLDQRQSGSVIYVAPAQEIAERERQQLEAQRQVRELEPLRTEFIRLDYVKAGEIAQIIRSESTRTVQSDVAGVDRNVRGFLSNRGHLEVHDATNTLLIRDTATQIAEIRTLIAALDIPVQQVLIESRIVIAAETFMRDLGTRFGVTGGRREGDTTYATSGSIPASSSIVGGGRVDPTGIGLNDRLNVSLPRTLASTGQGQIAFSILRPDVLLDLEISAAQHEGRSESLASPRLITSNGKTASITQGTQIPYRQDTDEGGRGQTEFKDATLETEVTPQITPNGNLILEIMVKKDEPDWVNAVEGQPAIATRRINTQVFLRNGETVVLGGIYETSSSSGQTKVPLLGDIPVVGAMFRNNSRSSEKRELLIFVTPKIVDQSTIN
nr:type IV pilus secretin PilQ family protein [Thiorhodospira sibirica]